MYVKPLRMWVIRADEDTCPCGEDRTLEVESEHRWGIGSGLGSHEWGPQ